MLTSTRIFLIALYFSYPQALGAMDGKHKEVVQLLLQEEDISATQLWKSLDGKRADDLEDNTVNSNHKKKFKKVRFPLANENFGSILHLAISKNTAIVEIIINWMNFEDLLMVDLDGNTALHLAIISDYRESVNKMFKGPLSLTGKNKYLSVLQQALLVTNNAGRNPMHEIIYYALNKGEEAAAEAEEWTLKVLALLIDNGLPPSLRETNESALSPIEIALFNGLKKSALFLAIKGAKLPKYYSQEHADFIANLKSIQNQVFEKSINYTGYLCLIKNNQNIEEEFKEAIHQSERFSAPNSVEWELIDQNISIEDQ